MDHASAHRMDVSSIDLPQIVSHGRRPKAQPCTQVIASPQSPMPHNRRCAPQPSLRSPQPVRMVRAGVHLSVDHRVHARQPRRSALLARLGVLVVDFACLACLLCRDMCLAQRRQSTERCDTGVKPRADVIFACVRVLVLGVGARERAQERGVATLAARRSDTLPRRQAVSRTGKDTQRDRQGLRARGAVERRQIMRADPNTTWLGGARARQTSSF